MPSFQALQAFVRVAQLSSFTQAAHSLGLPKASVSATVQRLEAELGTRLLHRSTRRVALTQDGQAYYERCLDLLADLDEMQQLFRPAAEGLGGRLRVDMPLRLASTLVLPALPQFLARHPELSLELGSTDRRVDLVREGYDCVLRVGPLGLSGAEASLVARPLGGLPMLNCASPGYLDRHGRPAAPQDLLAGHQLVHYQPVLGPRGGDFEWLDERAEPQRLALPGAITVNNTEAYLAACLAGLGLIQVPRHGVADLLAQGRLQELLPQHRAAPMPVHLLYAHRRQLPRRAQVFMQWLAELLAPCLEPLSSAGPT